MFFNNCLVNDFCWQYCIRGYDFSSFVLFIYGFSQQREPTLRSSFVYLQNNRQMNVKRYIFWRNIQQHTLITTQEQPTTLRALPVLSILQSPAHSPNFLLLSTLMIGIWCSEHNAHTNFLYIGSSQFSDNTQSIACLLNTNKIIK